MASVMVTEERLHQGKGSRRQRSGLHRTYAGFAEFQPELPGLLQQGGLLNDCIQVTQALGILEPFTGEHIPPEALLIQGPNWRESLVGNGLLSRNRAALVLLERLYGSLDALKQQDVYLVEALTGFALWLKRQLGDDRLVCSEYLDEAEGSFSEIPHQDLCALLQRQLRPGAVQRAV